MKNFTVAAIAAAGLTAAVLGLAAPAAAAPTAGGEAEPTIAQLEAEGYMVFVERLSLAPLDQKTIYVGVR